MPTDQTERQSSPALATDLTLMLLISIIWSRQAFDVAKHGAVHPSCKVLDLAQQKLTFQAG